jgi:hypothetical protein
MSDLLSTYACLAPRESSGLTQGRIEALIAALAVREQVDPAAGPVRRTLENLRNVTLPRIDAGVALESEILSTVDPAARWDRLVGVYLGLDERYNEIVGPWAVQRLIQGAHTGQGAEIVAALRRALPTIVTRPAPEARRARAVHAIDFFGGVLTPDEAKDVRPEYKRYDLLSND